MTDNDRNLAVSVLTLLVAVLAIVVGVTNPELRRALGLDRAGAPSPGSKPAPAADPPTPVVSRRPAAPPPRPGPMIRDRGPGPEAEPAPPAPAQAVEPATKLLSATPAPTPMPAAPAQTLERRNADAGPPATREVWPGGSILDCGEGALVMHSAEAVVYVQPQHGVECATAWVFRDGDRYVWATVQKLQIVLGLDHTPRFKYRFMLEDGTKTGWADYDTDADEMRSMEAGRCAIGVQFRNPDETTVPIVVRQVRNLRCAP